MNRPIFVILDYLVSFFTIDDYPLYHFVITDDYQTFRRVYENPILKSRAHGCSEKETELGEARSAQVSSI